MPAAAHNAAQSPATGTVAVLLLRLMVHCCSSSLFAVLLLLCFVTAFSSSKDGLLTVTTRQVPRRSAPSGTVAAGYADKRGAPEPTQISSMFAALSAAT